MSQFRCRRKGCDGSTLLMGGLCQYHLAPPDLDLAAKEDRDAEYSRPFDVDIAAMSGQELYEHPESQ